MPLNDLPSAIGTIAPAPTSGTVALSTNSWIRYPDFQLTFTLTGARIPVTDAAGSGSYGSLKLFDFTEGALTFLGCRQDYTAFAEGSALTTAAGDAAFVIAVGTGAVAAAADGALTGTSVNIGSTVSVTNSGGTGTGTAVDGAKTTGVNGTATAADIYLNWSGTAATIDANSNIDVTGTITVKGSFLGDD